jgi:hypothetical protein
MDEPPIKNSLHFNCYIEHSLSLKIAADENFSLFIKNNQQRFSEENRIKGLGLYRSTMLLYAISLELILKAHALYLEKENIIKGNIRTYRDFLNQWKRNGSGHNYFMIIEHYNLNINKQEKQLLINFQDHAVWAGRFPFPTNEDEIIKIGKKDSQDHRIRENHTNLLVEDFINKQISEMQ